MNPTPARPRAAYLLPRGKFDLIYGPDERADLAALFDLDPEPVDPARLRESSRAAADLLGDVEAVFTGWGAPAFTPEQLDAAPRLRAVFYGAGSVAGLFGAEAWARELVVCTAAAANAVPVAEFTAAAVTLALKGAFRHARHAATRGAFAPPGEVAMPGGYGTTVSLVSLGHIGRLVAARLRGDDLDLAAFDPFVPDADLAALGLRRVGLEQAFAESHVVSLHAPLLPETRGLVTGDLLRRMPVGGTFVNTARGAIVDEPSVVDALRDRPDLTAVLDVTHPEPPAAGSPLWSLPNVFLTPHVAGSQGRECRRMGRMMVDEARRWLAGEPLLHQVTAADLARSSHADPATAGR